MLLEPITHNSKCQEKSEASIITTECMALKAKMIHKWLITLKLTYERFKALHQIYLKDAYLIIFFQEPQCTLQVFLS